MISAAQVEAALPFADLVDKLDEAFKADVTVPLRHHHTLARADEPDATLLLMPAWRAGGAIGVKQVTIFPGNAARDLPAVNGVYFLLDGATGEPKAVIDGAVLTVRRTAAASALAARHLARADASRLLMVGAGKLAPNLIRAHAAVRPITDVAIWNRTRKTAETLAEELAGEDFAVTVVDDVESTARDADIISCATISNTPVVRGAWLKPGCHLDLVGGFTPEMRETDDDGVTRASIYVDTWEGGLNEAGDIVDPLNRGVIAREDIVGDIADLVSGRCRARQADDEITLCKLVGTALTDLAAAELLYERV